MGSQIQEYFSGKTVFLTGATGFLGKLVLEKLLRTCSDVKKIWLLMRDKRGMHPTDRLRELFDQPAFELLKTQRPNFLDKISLFLGDCELPHLGLSVEDLAELRNEVNVIIHCAATVRFDEELRKATQINVRSLQDLLRISKEMSSLTSFVYVSTAYSNCITEMTGEVFYKPALSGQKLFDLVNSLEDDVLNAITPIVIRGWANTYLFTKSVAEDVVKTLGANLPISIVRPSMITACAEEPLVGWVDNSFGPTRVLVQTSLGLLRISRSDPAKVADFIPADYVVNTILAASWETAETYTTGKVPPIYNCVSGCQNPITWAKYGELSNKYANELPTSLSMWHFIYFQIPQKPLFLLAQLLLHTLPACAMDLLLSSFGKKPKFVAMYKRIANFLERTCYFALRNWNFSNQNTQSLWNKMNAEDKGLFPFSIARVNWDEYFSDYMKGIRVYFLKDPLETLPRAQRKAFMFKIAHYILVSLILCLLLYLLYKIACIAL